MAKSHVIALVSLGSLAIVGCGPTPLGGSAGPFGAPIRSPLFAPFAGRWAFDLEKTLAAHKAAGATDDEIAKARQLHAATSRFGGMHGDLTFDGNQAVGAGLVSCEYWFFAMHRHQAQLCGKAWHHEDRFDPGDMSKCYVRLRTEGSTLYLDVNMLDGLPDQSDPDLRSDPPVDGDPSKCEADKQRPKDWTTYAFTRVS